MLRKLSALFILTAVLLIGAFSSAYAAEGKSFIALCYHNIEDNDPDQTYDGVSTARLIDQLSWLHHEGYKAVTINDLIAAKNGTRPLPDKAVLLTFDDGYESFYTRAYPVLKAFNMPAVIAVVDKWMANGTADAGDTKTGKIGKEDGDRKVEYGNAFMSRKFFLTWSQVREMQASGLIEVASHTDALHLGITANPQGNTEPSATTQFYDAKTGQYESAKSYSDRIYADAARATAVIKKNTGRKPRAIVWPYGSYNGLAISAYTASGMPITMSLDDGFATVDNLRNIPRQLINHDPALGDFTIDMRQMDKQIPIRVVQIDLDYVYDENPDQLAHNLDLLINRIHDLQINTVFLQAFADPKGTGLASEVYFPNRHLPMRADLFNRVAWQLKTRANVNVYGWLPVLSFDLGNQVTYVETMDKDSGAIKVDNKAYHRVSPFDAEGRRLIGDIYEDMSRSTAIDGLLFHDDATLSDYEDASPTALAAYQRAGFPTSLQVIRDNPEMMQKWSNFKTTTLIDFTKELTERVEKYHQPIKTVRDIYAPVLLNPQSENWFAQNYDLSLHNYDYVAIEAMPKMENVPDSKADAWIEKLVAAASRRAYGLKQTIFELQSVDWREGDSDDRAIPSEDLGAQMRLLTRSGALNFGYYPDDFAKNSPDVSVIHQDFSLQIYAYQP